MNKQNYEVKLQIKLLIYNINIPLCIMFIGPNTKDMMYNC